MDVCVCVCVCVCVYIHTYIHTYIHMKKARHSNNVLCAAGLFEDKTTELTYRADACIISAGAGTTETNNSRPPHALLRKRLQRL